VSEARAEPDVVQDEIRERLVAAAAEVFSEKGYDGARVGEIARRAGLTTGAIYGRFTGKAELLRAAIEAHSHSELEELFADHRFDGRITDILRTVGSHLVTREPTTEQALLLEAFVASRRDPEVKRVVSDLVRTRSERLAALVAEAKATDLVARDLDDLAVVCFAHALGLGFLLFDAVDYPLPSAEQWSTLIGRMVAALGDDA
jgi:TetR/AcrR family transcriptional repressor of uid operon